MPTPPIPALCALALLPAALGCSSSRPEPEADEVAFARSERHVIVVDDVDDEHYAFEFDVDNGPVRGLDPMADLFGGDERITLRFDDDGRDLEIEKEGKVDYDPETGAVTPLSAKARLVVTEDVDGLRRRVEVTRGAGGAPAYRYTVDGDGQAFGAEARAWMQGALGSAEMHGGREAERVYALRVHRDAMREHQDQLREHRAQLREHRSRLRDHDRAVRVRRFHVGDADSLRARLTIRDGVMTAIDDDGEVVVIDLDSLVSTSIDAAMEALGEMDFDFDFDEEDFRVEFDREAMEAETLRERAAALEEAAADLRREAEAMRREAEAAAREADGE